MTTTTDDIRTYPAYKPSGVEWLGDIPEHWVVKNANYIFTTINKRSIKGREVLLTVSEHHGVKLRSESNVNMFMAESYEGYKMCCKGDLVINSLWAWSRGLGFSNYDGIVSTAYSVYRPDKIEVDSDYLNYLLRTDLYVSRYLIASKGIWISRLQLSDWSFLRMPVLLPPFSEQTVIAQFLDSKTALIDKAIALKETQIALLKEHRQAEIDQAATKGLNPDVQMKDSGVDWIGKIPAHWEMKKAKFTFKKIEQGWSPQCDNYVAEIDEWGVLKVGCVNGFDFNPFENKVLPTDLKPRLEYQIKQGDILISRANTIDLVGSAAFVKEVKHRLLLCDKLYRVHIIKEKIDPEFYIFLLKTSYARSHIEIHASGASPTMQNIGQDCIKNMLLFLPDIEEQKNIVSYLKRLVKKISVSISLKEKEIEKIKEYKESLINSSVTGKIKIA